jgi:RimJ/RimL family protein N-acetyltransferase
VIAGAIAAARLHADRLIATTEHSNAASIGVMRRLGMEVQRNPDAQWEWFQTVGVLFDASAE